jgi:lipopolysaccharide export system protein LptA
LWVAAVLLQTAVPCAAQKQPASLAPVVQPITITAERLVNDGRANTAEFSGNVRVVRGNGRLEADRLTIYYRSTPTSPQTQPLEQSEIQQIVAQGNVRIRSPEITAETQQAVYNQAERTIALSGAGSRVTHAQAVLKAARITFQIDSGILQAQGETNNRVSFVFRGKAPTGD